MRAPIFYGKVDKGKIKLDNRDLFTGYLAGLTGKRVKLVLEEYTGNRTDRQNAYYWAVVVPMIGDYLGYTDDEMHQEIKRKFGVTSTAKMKVGEFKEFVDKVVRWAAVEFSISIPDPESVEF